MKKSSVMEHLRHELLTDIDAHVKAFLVEFGVEPEIAEHVAINLVNHLVEHWGGQLINFPKDHIYKNAKRDAEIYDAFDGNNHAALSREFGVSVRAIYDIIRRTRKRRIDEVQISLF